jgi:hypothetical protein
VKESIRITYYPKISSAVIVICKIPYLLLLKAPVKASRGTSLCSNSLLIVLHMKMLYIALLNFPRLMLRDPQYNLASFGKTNSCGQNFSRGREVDGM